MADELTADEIRALLKLEPNATCGFVQMTYLSTQSIAAGGLPPPFADARPMGSALYFMVTPVAPVRLHRIRNDQLYHYYLGDPLEVLLLHGNDTTSAPSPAPTCAGRARAAAHPRQHVPCCTAIRRCRFLGASTEWPSRAPRRRLRCREAGGEISGRRRRSARDHDSI